MAKSIFITGPEPQLKLVPNDVWLPGLYSRRILCFELSPNSSRDQVIDVVRRGLQALVTGTPELGATSVVVPDAAPHDSSQPWRALVPGKGIELVIKDLSASFKTFEQLEKSAFPITEFRDSELMPIEGPIVPEPAAIARFQLSFIGGGVLLSSCLYHHLTDGNGMNAIMRAIAEECSKATKTSEDLPPRVMDTSRAVFEATKDGLTDLKNHPAYNIVDGAFIPGAHHDEPNAGPPPRFCPQYYYLTDSKAQALKAYGSTHSPVSTHDAMNAALWRNLIISRVHTKELTDLSQTSTLSIPHNARKYLGLPSTWVGNCTYFIAAQATISEILEPESLPLLASRIRAAMNNVTPEHVKGVVVLRKQNPYGLNWWPIMQAAEPQIVGLTSFYHSELMDTHWGDLLKEPKHFTTTDLGGFAEQFQRAHFVGPRLGGGKGCFVYAGVLEGEVESFQREEVWNRFFKLKNDEEVADGVQVENTGTGLLASV